MFNIGEKLYYGFGLEEVKFLCLSDINKDAAVVEVWTYHSNGSMLLNTMYIALNQLRRERQLSKTTTEDKKHG